MCLDTLYTIVGPINNPLRRSYSVITTALQSIIWSRNWVTKPTLAFITYHIGPLFSKCYFSERSTSGTPTGIRLNFTTKLENLDFAEDFALISSKYEHIQSKNNEITSKRKPYHPDNKRCQS